MLEFGVEVDGLLFSALARSRCGQMRKRLHPKQLRSLKRQPETPNDIDDIILVLSLLYIHIA